MLLSGNRIIRIAVTADRKLLKAAAHSGDERGTEMTRRGDRRGEDALVTALHTTLTTLQSTPALTTLQSTPAWVSRRQVWSVNTGTCLARCSALDPKSSAADDPRQAAQLLFHPKSHSDPGHCRRVATDWD
ncbi:hypothetical protein ACOMHN_046455 [Nucella lapillus]